MKNNMQEKEQILKVEIQEGLKYDGHIFLPYNRKPYEYFTVTSKEKEKVFKGSFGRYKVKIIVQRLDDSMRGADSVPETPQTPHQLPINHHFMPLNDIQLKFMNKPWENPDDQTEYVTSTSTWPPSCEHKNGWYDSVRTWFSRIKVFVCTDCDRVIRVKDL